VINLWVMNVTSCLACSLWRTGRVIEYNYDSFIVYNNIIGLHTASSSSRLNLHWNSLAFIYKQDKDIPLLPRSEARNAEYRHFENLKCRISISALR